ncbi:Protein Piccolo [Manis pentadactyla]|nr:Protein Piccolo [Manis pentadactyla]
MLQASEPEDLESGFEESVKFGQMQIFFGQQPCRAGQGGDFLSSKTDRGSRGPGRLQDEPNSGIFSVSTINSAAAVLEARPGDERQRVISKPQVLV